VLAGVIGFGTFAHLVGWSFVGAQVGTGHLLQRLGHGVDRLFHVLSERLKR
jgi:hypothetical protein